MSTNGTQTFRLTVSLIERESHCRESTIKVFHFLQIEAFIEGKLLEPIEAF